MIIAAGVIGLLIALFLFGILINKSSAYKDFRNKQNDLAKQEALKYQGQTLTIEQFKLIYEQLKLIEQQNCGVVLIHNLTKNKVLIACDENNLFEKVHSLLNDHSNAKFKDDLNDPTIEFSIQIVKTDLDDLKDAYQYFLKKYRGIGQKY